MTKLVISVRSADEAEAALHGGADLIDVKEPSRGSLGRADPKVVREVVRAVDGRLPVSAALGEWRERDLEAEEEILALGLRFVKWGFSGYPRGMPTGLAERREALPRQTEMVLTAYGDSLHAESPEPDEVCFFAARYDFGTVLFDTYVKDGKTLIDHFTSVDELAAMVRSLRTAGIETVLAGSLSESLIHDLLPSRPSWFAVRGAACGAGDRDGTIDECRVARMKAIFHFATASGVLS